MLFQPLHKLTHASENDNKNDSKEVRMNLPQRRSITIKVLNKRKKPKIQANAHITQTMCEWIIKSPQPKPMPLNDEFQGELLMTVLVMCVHAQKIDTTSGLSSLSKDLFTKITIL